MKVSTIAIRPIWKLEMRRLWFGFISACPRSEDAVSVLLEEEVRLAERRHAGCLGHVLDSEGGVVLLLARGQRFAEGVARLAGLAIRLAVSHGRAVWVAVQDGHDQLVVRVAVVGPHRVEDARVLRGE